jgi:hypothetical protein
MVTKTDQLLADQKCVKLWSSTLQSGYLSMYNDGLWAGPPGFDSRQCKNFSLPHIVQTGCEAHPASYPMGTEDSFRGG